MQEFLVKTTSGLIQHLTTSKREAYEVAQLISRKYATTVHIFNSDQQLIHTVSF
jgi:hypothetical protein